ncbi:hypothetical protein [Nocardia cyriacigeorgica]|uniref:hypothetical protein n=1 Tax=Nocardia cyriacigeorgica TaxID=135487 RepID=UPI002458FEF1|nr:hypothetical protein [Nocardia cyriacigeorgica]
MLAELHTRITELEAANTDLTARLNFAGEAFWSEHHARKAVEKQNDELRQELRQARAAQPKPRRRRGEPLPPPPPPPRAPAPGQGPR